MNLNLVEETDSQSSLESHTPKRKTAILKPKKFANCKKRLRISIPSETDVETLMPTQRFGCFSDKSESGSFYAATVKKGDYRRCNEDRVLSNVTVSLLQFQTLMEYAIICLWGYLMDMGVITLLTISQNNSPHDSFIGMLWRRRLNKPSIRVLLKL